MLRSAVSGQPGFVVDEREIRRPGGSYTYDTLRSLRAELGAELPVCLLLGSDAFADFLSWHCPDGIVDLAHLVVMRRPYEGGALRGPLRAFSEPRLCTDAAELAEVSHGRILFRSVTRLEISATMVRDLVSRGLSPRYLLPNAVIDIIERENLYRP
jgi:nicotinate-nucleotide adenylyltransferase